MSTVEIRAGCRIWLSLPGKASTGGVFAMKEGHSPPPERAEEGVALSAEKSLNAGTRLPTSQVFLNYLRWTLTQDGPVSLIQSGFRFAGELLRFRGTG